MAVSETELLLKLHRISIFLDVYLKLNPTDSIGLIDGMHGEDLCSKLEMLYVCSGYAGQTDPECYNAAYKIASVDYEDDALKQVAKDALDILDKLWKYVKED